MKKIICILVLFVLLCIVVAVSTGGIDERTPQERFAQAMVFARYDTYVDHDMGYTIDYPSFFTRDDESEFGIGHVRFGYHILTDLVLECKVVPESIYVSRCENFVETGYVDKLQAYRYVAHYISHEHRWYILSFYYLIDYQSAVSGIIYRVKRWKIGTKYELNGNICDRKIAG